MTLAAGGAAGAVISMAPRRAGAAQAIEMQLGWIGGGNQLGEVVAMHMGYFAEEGLELKITPGGPNNDGVADLGYSARKDGLVKFHLSGSAWIYDGMLSISGADSRVSEAWDVTTGVPNAVIAVYEPPGELM